METPKNNEFYQKLLMFIHENFYDLIKELNNLHGKPNFNVVKFNLKRKSDTEEEKTPGKRQRKIIKLSKWSEQNGAENELNDENQEPNDQKREVIGAKKEENENNKLTNELNEENQDSDKKSVEEPSNQEKKTPKSDEVTQKLIVETSSETMETPKQTDDSIKSQDVQQLSQTHEIPMMSPKYKTPVKKQKPSVELEISRLHRSPIVQDAMDIDEALPNIEKNIKEEAILTSSNKLQSKSIAESDIIETITIEDEEIKVSSKDFKQEAIVIDNDVTIILPSYQMEVITIEDEKIDNTKRNIKEEATPAESNDETILISQPVPNDLECDDITMIEYTPKSNLPCVINLAADDCADQEPSLLDVINEESIVDIVQTPIKKKKKQSSMMTYLKPVVKSEATEVAENNDKFVHPGDIVTPTPIRSNIAKKRTSTVTAKRVRNDEESSSELEDSINEENLNEKLNLILKRISIDKISSPSNLSKSFEEEKEKNKPRLRRRESVAVERPLKSTAGTEKFNQVSEESKRATRNRSEKSEKSEGRSRNSSNNSNNDSKGSEKSADMKNDSKTNVAEQKNSSLGSDKNHSKKDENSSEDSIKSDKITSIIEDVKINQKNEADKKSTSNETQDDFMNETVLSYEDFAINHTFEDFSKLYPWISSDEASNISKTKSCHQVLLTENCLFSTYKCMQNTCSFYTTNFDDFRKHVKNYDDVTHYCSYCIKEFQKPDELCDHINQEHKFDRLQCNKCMFRACQKLYVEMHQKKYHKDEENCEILKSPVQIFTKADKHNIVDKVLKVNREKFVRPYRCRTPNCTKSYFCRNNFKSHLNSEVSKPSLKQHLNIINDQITALDKTTSKTHGNNQCLFCQFGNDNEEVLLEHLANNHHSELAYVCKRKIRNNVSDDKSLNKETLESHTSIEFIGESDAKLKNFEGDKESLQKSGKTETVVKKKRKIEILALAD